MKLPFIFIKSDLTLWFMSSVFINVFVFVFELWFERPFAELAEKLYTESIFCLKHREWLSPNTIYLLIPCVNLSSMTLFFHESIVDCIPYLGTTITIANIQNAIFSIFVYILYYSNNIKKHIHFEIVILMYLVIFANILNRKTTYF